MKLPNFEFEQQLWKKGMRFVAGADEVGRGCFAGPVTAGCVIFSSSITIEQLNNEAIEINDSKKMKHEDRKRSAVWIRKNSLSWGIGSASVKEINRLGMGKAAKRAFRRAIGDAEKRLEDRIEFLLLDAFYVPHVGGLPIKKRTTDVEELFNSNSRQLAIKRGDTKSLSIAAASIVAKVHRDNLMRELGSKKDYIKYDWKNNKGYASKKHRSAIIEHGICSHHRTQFVETYLMNHQPSRS